MNDIINGIIDLLTKKFGGEFKLYNFGDPKVYNRTELPAIFVIPTATVLENAGTVRDKIKHTVTIKVIIDFKNFLKYGNTEQQTAEKKLIQYMEKTEDFEIESDTILGIIRENIDIDGATLFSTNIAINYTDEFIEDENTLIKKAEAVIQFEKRGLR